MQLVNKSWIILHYFNFLMRRAQIKILKYIEYAMSFASFLNKNLSPYIMKSKHAPLVKRVCEIFLICSENHLQEISARHASIKIILMGIKHQCKQWRQSTFFIFFYSCLTCVHFLRSGSTNVREMFFTLKLGDLLNVCMVISSSI